MQTVTYLSHEITDATSYNEKMPKPRLDQQGYTRSTGSPTEYRLKFKGSTRWFRVYYLQFSNAASHFVRYKNERLYLRGSHWDDITDLAAQEKSKRSSHVGQIVVLNELPDAVRWEILEVSDHDGMFTVREEGTDYRPQLIHASQIHKRV